MGKIEKQRFEVYLLDMYEDEYGDWQENERHLLGHLTVGPLVGNEIDARDILGAMHRFSYPDLVGRKIRALDTVDQRRVYAEDLYGSGILHHQAQAEPADAHDHIEHALREYRAL